jgi:hypothetical protein
MRERINSGVCGTVNMRKKGLVKCVKCNNDGVKGSMKNPYCKKHYDKKEFLEKMVEHG